MKIDAVKERKLHFSVKMKGFLISFLIYAWLNSTCSPPPPDKSSPSCPAAGVENCLMRFWPGVRGRGTSKKLLRASALSNAMATHRFSAVKRIFVGKPIEFVSNWLEQNNF